MSYSLYSPFVPRIRVLDASGQPVATARVSAPVYQSETKYVNYDASVAVENESWGILSGNSGSFIDIG